MSRDHDWGLRLTVVVPPHQVEPIDHLLEDVLPLTFLGHPVRFPTTWEPRVRQRAEVVDVRELARSRTGVEVDRPLALGDWLSLTGQGVLEATAGPLFRDDERVLRGLRTTLAALPPDVSRWAVASAWRKLAQELPSVGRTGSRGDESGSAVITARMVAIVMRLVLLLDGTWAPYAKWLGTAFLRSSCAEALDPLLRLATSSATWRARQDAIVEALEIVARRQRGSGLPTLLPVTEPFWDRPFAGVRDLAGLLRDGIDDPVLRGLPLVGTPELWTEDVAILTDHRLRRLMVDGFLGSRGTRTDEVTSAADGR